MKIEVVFGAEISEFSFHLIVREKLPSLVLIFFRWDMIIMKNKLGIRKLIER